MNIIFLGAPGAGKGTQAQNVSERYSIPAISTGNMIREAIKNETPMGLKAKEAAASGCLVSDEIVIGIVKDRLKKDDCKNGFILDGFPRTISQAEALDAMDVKIDRVIEISVEDGTILERLSGRRVCPNCGASYHIKYKKPAKDNVCDVCKAGLEQRKDDRREVIENRLDVYHRETEPLKTFYEKKGLLRVVEGQEDVADTTRLTIKALEE